MATFDYIPLREKATELIIKYGRDAVLQRTELTGPPFARVPVTTSHNVKVVVTEYNDDDIDNQSIMMGDKKLLLAASGLSVEPNTTTDSVLIGGEQYAIMNSKPVNPGGTVVVYELQVRK